MIYFLLILPFFSTLSFAQKPVFGIKIGCAISDAKIDQTDGSSYTYSYSSKVGILGGVYTDIPLGKKLIFRPEAVIVSKGTKQKDGYSSSYNYPIRFTFIDFPLNILFRKDFTKGHLLTGAGPVIGFPINYRYSDFLLKTEFSINGLIGYETAIGFSLTINYTYGLSNASNGSTYIYVAKISNRYVGISVGYSF